MSDAFTEITPFVVAENSRALLRDEVIRRMEVYVLELLYRLLTATDEKVATTSGNLPNPPVYTTARQKTTQTKLDISTRRDMIQNASGTATSAQLTLPTAQRSSLRQRTLQVTRQHLLLLRELFANVQRGTVQTHRDVYYHLVRHVPTQLTVNRTVQQLARVLRLPRELLGVTAGGRGYVAGVLRYRGTSLDSGMLSGEEGLPLPLMEADLAVTCVTEHEEEVVEVEDSNRTDRCDALRVSEEQGLGMSTSMACNGSTEACAHVREHFLFDSPCESSEERGGLEPFYQTEKSFSADDLVGFQISPHVRFILVVEKHAVFVHLLREGLPQLVPCVLLTAQGFPTRAAHRLLANLHAAVPHAVVVGLVDYNPHGLAILAAYRWPCSRHLLHKRTTTTSMWGNQHLQDAPAAEEAPLHAAASAPRAVRSAAMPENRFCAVPSLRWLAVRAAQVRLLERNLVNAETQERRAPVRACTNAHNTTASSITRLSKAKEVVRGPASNMLKQRSAKDQGVFTGNPTGYASAQLNSHSMFSVYDAATNERKRAESASPAATEGNNIFRFTDNGARAFTSQKPAQPPTQPFTQRDAVVLDNLIRQLEEKVQPNPSTALPMDDGRAQRVPASQDAGAPFFGTEVRHISLTPEAASALVYDKGSRELNSLSSNRSSAAAWLREAKAMRAGGAKCELEVLYTHPFSMAFCGMTASFFYSRAETEKTNSGSCQDAGRSASGPTASFAHWVAEQLLRGHYV